MVDKNHFFCYNFNDMKANIYTAKLNNISAEYMLSTLRNRDINCKYIIITPDRCTLNYEQKLFDLLQTDSFFDVNVVTLTRLTRKILAEKKINHKVLTMQGGVSIIQKLLIENKNDLLSFSNSYRYPKFSLNLFETIAMFKSCFIAPNDIVDNIENVALANKLHDIKLIYTKYEDYLQNEYTDSFNQLNLLSSIIDDSLKDTHFYFVGFDDFTKQAYNIITSLIKHSASVNIATSFSEASNKNIYLNNIYANTMQLCDILGVAPNIIKVDSNLTPVKDAIANTTFSFNSLKFDASDYVKCYNFDNINDEIYHTISQIKFDVINKNLKYSDFAIILPDYERYEDLLKSTCDKFDIPYFFDKGKNLIDVSSFAFVSQLINLPLNYERGRVLALLKNAYLQLPCSSINTYQTLTTANGVNYSALFECNSDFSGILKILKEYCASQDATIENHINKLNDTLEKLNFSENLMAVKSTYLDNDVVEYKLLDQTQNKLQKIYDELLGIMSNYECDYSTFVAIFDAYLNNTPIAMPPITSSLFVGDQLNSTLYNKKFVYMLGVNEGSVPSYNQDFGLISDDDIKRIPHKLNPTVAYVNKKRKYKVFENLFSASDKLILSYVNQSISGEQMYASSFLVNLCSNGNIAIVNGSAECDVFNANLHTFDNENIIFNNFNKASAKDNFVHLLKGWQQTNTPSYIQLVSTLNDVVEGNCFLSNANFNNTKSQLSNVNELFFTKGKSSISQIQTYYKCPYEHFATYGLKLQPVKTDTIKPVDYGNIIHEFLEQSVPLLKEDVNIPQLVNEILNTILKEKYQYLLNNAKNNYLIKALFNECVRMLKAIKYQNSVSKFKPKFYELPFGGNKGVEVAVNGKKVIFGGIIDRVDEYNGHFRIIDYKTGSDEFKDFGEVKLGTRLQLIMYLKQFKDNTSLKPAGAFYLPIVNDFGKNGINDMYKLKGIMLDEMNIVLAMDSSLENVSTKSNVINAKTLKDGMFDKQGSNLRLSPQDFDILCDYVYDLLVKAVKEITNGNIAPEPVDFGIRKECEYCPYLGMCNFNERYGNVIKAKEKVDTVSKLTEEE